MNCALVLVLVLVLMILHALPEMYLEHCGRKGRKRRHAGEFMVSCHCRHCRLDLVLCFSSSCGALYFTAIRPRSRQTTRHICHKPYHPQVVTTGNHKNASDDIPMAANSNLPYQPRRQRSRPERPLPAPPPEEDVPAQNAFEIVQGFTSPPSPPKQAAALPPPPTGKQPSPPPDADADVAEAGDSVAQLAIADENKEQARARPPVPDTAARVAASHINPYHSTLPSSELTPPTILTPLRAHYLKKSLVSHQISHELNLITDPLLGANALGLLGPPFVIPDALKKDIVQRVGRGAIPESGQIGDLPFLRFMFSQFVLPFPFLASAAPTFWSHKVQPFLSSFLATTGQSTHSTLSDEQKEISDSLMTKEEKKEAEERRKLWSKFEKHVGMMLGVGIKLVGGEEVVRIGQSELRRIEQAQEARRKKLMEKHRLTHQPDHITFDVNVVGVRAVREKGRVRSKQHEEFIIRTQRTGVPDAFVSRRYGDFRRLAEEVGGS